jgi:RNA polymerase sigma-70 factor (ECF subfamily)
VSVPDWRQIVTEHSPAVWKTACRVLGNDADAADCLQDAFVSALEVSGRQEVRSWAALLQHLATRRALDRLRERMRLARHHEHPADLADVASSEPGPAQYAQSTELAESLLQALAELPPQQAEAFSLREFSELSYDEIAAGLDITPNAVGVLLHRARARLGELLAQHKPGHEARCFDA